MWFFCVLSRRFSRFLWQVRTGFSGTWQDKMGSYKKPKLTTKKAKSPRKKKKRFSVVHRPLIVKIDGENTLLYSVGHLCNEIGYGLTTVWIWTNKGFVSETYKDRLGRRWYSEDYIVFLKKMIGRKVEKELWMSLWRQEQDGKKREG
jgi:hypothetical protein